METWDAIRSRRQVREFTDQQIGDSDLDLILEAAWRTPSSRNTQPWEFIVVTGAEELERLSAVWRGAWHIAGASAAVAIVTPQPETERSGMWALIDIGQVLMSIQLAATDLGIGSGIAAVDDQDLARNLLGLPDGYTCVSIVSLGYPADRPLRPMKKLNRRPLDEVVRRGRF